MRKPRVEIEKSVALAYQFSERLNSLGMDIWLVYGSSLGAVREGGIIEGDGDIDLMMWDEDFMKFREMLTEGKFFDMPSFKYDFRHKPSGGQMCKMTLGSNRFLPKGESAESWTEPHCLSCGTVMSSNDLHQTIVGEYNTPHNAEYLCQNCIEYGNQFNIDIFSLKKSLDGVRCYCDTLARRKSHPRTPTYKLYHYENLRKIKFENLDFYVSKYAEETLDFLYNGADGTDNTWRTPITRGDINWNGTPSRDKEDEITGCVMGVFDLFHIGHLRLLERSSKIFDKVVAAVHSDATVLAYKKKTPIIPYEHRVEVLKGCRFVDEVIEAPLRPQTVEWLNDNNLDYLVHAQENPKFLEKHYSEIINENRLLLLEETKDYHTSDLIKRINS